MLSLSSLLHRRNECVHVRLQRRLQCDRLWHHLAVRLCVVLNAPPRSTTTTGRWLTGAARAAL
jgi:hypothetical protein